MAKIILLFIVMVMITFLQACATNIVYSDKDRQMGEIPPEQGLSIFIDRNGELYPPPSLAMGNSMFTSQRETTATLQAYFVQASNSADWEALLSELNITNTANFSDLWPIVQQQLFTRVTDAISQGSEHGKRKIVFLVHGYNNEFMDAECWYSLVEQDIAKRASVHGESRPYFIRVYWDGLSQALPVSIWTKAQWNGPITGLALRRILYGLEGKLSKETQIAMLSHSTGALVVANAVGDGSASLECKANFQAHCPAIRDMASIPTLVSTVRLGVLIPAASPDTFDCFKDKQKLPQAIILGLNQQDFPTNKVFGCIWLGTTCMNVYPEYTCSKLQKTFANSPVEYAVFEFSNSSHNENQQLIFWETHSVKDQMQRDMWPAFIERVIFPGANVNSNHPVQCEQQPVEI
ncbi:hypothetical protein [Shewanella dokdonensis]|uniref:Alpha/beta hydrolase n=1 Tax=Shewanella dokdonensis TaxID=712036 RepID=A0ABX8DF87_9GAMM|nr:hypothetical protein [Shewanella dokdonensis]MCL1074934.1 hypothetical protein [Shewanella dokdonensis]QVK23379.1 hypothetical protein KHX94_00775 [Shewanella dokdonensis]